MVLLAQHESFAYVVFRGVRGAIEIGECPRDAQNPISSTQAETTRSNSLVKQSCCGDAETGPEKWRWDPGVQRERQALVPPAGSLPRFGNAGRHLTGGVHRLVRLPRTRRGRNVNPHVNTVKERP